jgi:hypothetical protein
VGPTVDRGWYRGLMGAGEMSIEERILMTKQYRGWYRGWTSADSLIRARRCRFSAPTHKTGSGHAPTHVLPLCRINRCCSLRPGACCELDTVLRLYSSYVVWTWTDKNSARTTLRTGRREYVAPTLIRPAGFHFHLNTSCSKVPIMNTMVVKWCLNSGSKV